MSNNDQNRLLAMRLEFDSIKNEVCIMYLYILNNIILIIYIYIIC